MVHFYRNVFTAIPRGRMKEVIAMLKAIHSQEDHQATTEKARAIVRKLKTLKLQSASKIVEEGAMKPSLFTPFPANTGGVFERIIHLRE